MSILCLTRFVQVNSSKFLAKTSRLLARKCINCIFCSDVRLALSIVMLMSFNVAVSCTRSREEDDDGNDGVTSVTTADVSVCSILAMM